MYFFFLFYPPSFFLLFSPPFLSSPPPTALGVGRGKNKKDRRRKTNDKNDHKHANTATTDNKHFRFPAARVVREIATCGWLVMLLFFFERRRVCTHTSVHTTYTPRNQKIPMHIVTLNAAKRLDTKKKKN